MAESNFQSRVSVESLRLRSELLGEIRDFFRSRDFLEVETPLLSADVVVDRHIEPIPVPSTLVSERLPTDKMLWLQTSPEFAMKRLLAGGADRIFQITKAFRKSERGAMHNPEFTILEWYRVGDDYEQGRRLLAEFAEALLCCGPLVERTYGEAFSEGLGICPHTTPLPELEKLIRSRTGLELQNGNDRDELLNVLLSQVVEPGLGRESPEIVFDFPGTQAALAGTRDERDFQVAERFELYWKGVELANGYHELTDAEELLRRNRVVNRQRVSDGRTTLPEDSRLVSAMRAGLPDCCGVALGVDRLAMLRTGADSIDEVIAFPVEQA